MLFDIYTSKSSGPSKHLQNFPIHSYCEPLGHKQTSYQVDFFPNLSKKSNPRKLNIEPVIIDMLVFIPVYICGIVTRNLVYLPKTAGLFFFLSRDIIHV